MRISELQPVLFLVGCILATEGTVMLIPAIIDLDANNPDWRVFATAAALTGFLGVALAVSNHRGGFELSHKQAFLLTAITWFAVALVGALPYYFASLPLGLADAFFESASGFTTTGSTVLVGLDTMAPGILVWRGLQQWFGGIGIIVLASAVLPILKVGGMQLFHTESSDRSDKIFPQMRKIAASIAGVYVGLTALAAIAYDLAGMTTFEAIIHAMTTIATGGFSTSDASLGHWDNPAVHLVAIVFMIFGSLPFVHYIRVAQGRPGPLLQDPQVRYFAVIVLIAWLILVATRAPLHEEGLGQLALHAAVNIVSVITTTGYASTDYTLWGPLVSMIFLFATVIGGCSGSTSGGLKVFRLQLLLQLVSQQLDRLVYPRGVFPLRHWSERVHSGSDGIPIAVVTFAIAYIGTIVVLAAILAATGLDLVTSFSAAAQAISNVGPGLGPIIGPAGNFASLSDLAKWVLAFAMILGRLEIMTVLVLIAPKFWRT